MDEPKSAEPKRFRIRSHKETPYWIAVSVLGEHGAYTEDLANAVAMAIVAERQWAEREVKRAVRELRTGVAR